MLLRLENTNQENINRLLEFAKQNKLELSLIDSETDYTLPGKTLTPQQLSDLIESSRKSGIISMHDAHKLIRSKYDAN
jgi:molybdenum cofactor biosynthesis enzyme MoaA